MLKLAAILLGVLLVVSVMTVVDTNHSAYGLKATKTHAKNQHNHHWEDQVCGDKLCKNTTYIPMR